MNNLSPVDTCSVVVWQRFCEPARLRIAYCQSGLVLSDISRSYC